MGKKVVPLSKSTHAALSLRSVDDLSGYANVPTIPVYGAEVSRLALNYPLALVQQGEKFGLHILCSLSTELPNGWITPNGKWAGNYLPAIIRQNPFTVIPNKEGQLVLCIDEESPLLGDEGRPLFDDDGEPTELLKGVLQFGKSLFHNGTATQQAVDLAQEYELIVPWEIKIQQPEGEEIPVEVIYRFDEAGLNELKDEQWLALKKAGALPLIYGQMLSMGNLNKLVQILKIRVEAESSKAAAEQDLDTFFGEGDDELSFEGL